MPTYEYECQKCGDHTEIFQSITDKPRQRCGKCRGKLKRLIGKGAGIIFKGSGFYQTDYRSSDYKKKAAADKAPSDSSNSSSKTETSGSTEKKKPAEKTGKGKASTASK